MLVSQSYQASQTQKSDVQAPQNKKSSSTESLNNSKNKKQSSEPPSPSEQQLLEDIDKRVPKFRVVPATSSTAEPHSKYLQRMLQIKEEKKKKAKRLKLLRLEQSISSTGTAGSCVEADKCLKINQERLHVLPEIGSSMPELNPQQLGQPHTAMSQPGFHQLTQDHYGPELTHYEFEIDEPAIKESENANVDEQPEVRDEINTPPPLEEPCYSSPSRTTSTPELGQIKRKGKIFVLKNNKCMFILKYPGVCKVPYGLIFFPILDTFKSFIFMRGRGAWATDFLG